MLVLPGLAQPFSTPKLIFLVAFVGFGLLFAPQMLWSGWLSLPTRAQWVLLAWTSALALSSLLGEWVSLRTILLHIGAVGWFLLVLELRQKREALARAVVLSASGVAAIALLQFAKADPFGLAGWVSSVVGAERMRIYSTLGNPNFVGAFLAGVIPLTWMSCRGRQRFWVQVALALQIVALFATGSRGALLGLGGAALWFILARARVRWRAAAVVAVLVAATVLLLVGDRPLARSIEGRLYVGRVVTSGIAECVLSGCGPGAFEAKYATWETTWWRDNSAAGQSRRFAGLQNHAHNDYLEILVEDGALGLLAFLGLIGMALVSARAKIRGGREPLLAGASAGIVALAAMALVDFPFARPETLILFWTLLTFVVARPHGGEAHREVSAAKLTEEQGEEDEE